MNLETFTRIIESIEKDRDNIHELYKLGVDVVSVTERLHETINSLLMEMFGKKGTDWIDWYVYERTEDSREPYKATDAEGNEICYDIESLYKEVCYHVKIH